MGILWVDLAGSHALPAPNQLLLLQDLIYTEECEWAVKSILDRQIHANIVPCPLEPLKRGPIGAERRCDKLNIRMCGRNERVGAVFQHICAQDLGEGLEGCV